VQEDRTQQRHVLRLNLHDGTSDAPQSQVEVEEVFYTRLPYVRTFGEADQRVYALLNARSVSLWTPATGEVVTPVQQKTSIRTIAIRGDERLVVTTGATNAYVWSLPDGKKLLELKHR